MLSVNRLTVAPAREEGDVWCRRVAADEEQTADRRLDRQLVEAALSNHLSEADGFAAAPDKNGLARQVRDALECVDLVLESA